MGTEQVLEDLEDMLEDTQAEQFQRVQTESEEAELLEAQVFAQELVQNRIVASTRAGYRASLRKMGRWLREYHQHPVDDDKLPLLPREKTPRSVEEDRFVENVATFFGELTRPR